MMTEEEAEAFKAYPGAPGIYRFQAIKADHNYTLLDVDVLRRWDGKHWFLGLRQEGHSVEGWVSKALRASDKIDKFEMMMIALTKGRPPYRFATLSGEIIPPAPLEPDQLDLFDFN